MGWGLMILPMMINSDSDFESESEHVTFQPVLQYLQRLDEISKEAVLPAGPGHSIEHLHSPIKV